MDDKCFEAFERIRTLEQWKDGNGGKGVEERLRHLENMVEKIDHRTIWIIILLSTLVVQKAPEVIGMLAKAVIP